VNLFGWDGDRGAPGLFPPAPDAVPAASDAAGPTVTGTAAIDETATDDTARRDPGRLP
jgi:hypothetical protein